MSTGTQSPRLRRAVRPIAVAAIGALAFGTLTAMSFTLSAAPAEAATTTYKKSSGGETPTGGYVGSFLGADGSITYCVDGPLHYPFDNGGIEYGDPYEVANFVTGPASANPNHAIGEKATAVLAWIMDRYGKSSDQATAAAVQQIVWDNTGDPGLGSNVDSAGVPAAAVSAKKAEINLAVQTEGYQKALAETTITDNENGTGTVVVNVRVQKFDGSWVDAAAGTFMGTLSATNAVFDINGESTASVTNGAEYTVNYTGNTAGKANVQVSGEFPGLAAEYHMLIRDPQGANASEWQRVIQAGKSYTTVKTQTAPIDVTLPNGAQLNVSTKISEHVIDQANLPVTLQDTINVGVNTTDQNANAAWPVDAAGDPVEAKVTVTLYKHPDGAPFEESETIPEGAVIVGSDSVTATAAGEYTTTTGVQVTEPGRYVFVESIEAVGVPFGNGTVEKVGPFQGNYGIADESAYIPSPPAITTDSIFDDPYLGTAVADSINVTGFASGAAAVDVNVYAVGPFGPAEEKPTFASKAAIETAGKLAGQTSVTISGNGTVNTPEITGVTPNADETYYFMYESTNELPTGANPDSVVAPFQDFGYYAEESYTVAPIPEVTTVVSDTITTENGLLSDHLSVSGLQDGDKMNVVSTLYGPLESATAGDNIPADAPVAGTVNTEVTADGVYETEAVRIGAAGYYVWGYEYTTTGKDGSTKPAIPVKDSVIYAPETSYAPPAPTFTTQTHLQEAYPGAYLSDHMVAEGVDAFKLDEQMGLTGLDGETPAEGEGEATAEQPTASSTARLVEGEAGESIPVTGVPVDSILIGPFTTENAPAEGEELTAEFIAEHEVGRVTTSVTHDATYQTEGIQVQEAGLYVFVYESPGLTTCEDVPPGPPEAPEVPTNPETPPGEECETLIPPFKDSSVHKPETTTVNPGLDISSNVAKLGTEAGLVDGENVVISMETQPEFNPGDKVADTLHIQGYSKTALPDGFTLTSSLVGPYKEGEQPKAGDVLDMTTAPVVGSVETLITGNGSYVTEGVELPKDVYDAKYIWVYSYDSAKQLTASVYAPTETVAPEAADAPEATASATPDPSASATPEEPTQVIGGSIGVEDDIRNIVLPDGEDNTVYDEESLTVVPEPENPVTPAAGKGASLAGTGDDLGALWWLLGAAGAGIATVATIKVRNKRKGEEA